MCVWAAELADRVGFWGIWTLFLLKPFICSFRNEQSGKPLHFRDAFKASPFRLGLAAVPCEAVALSTQQILHKPGRAWLLQLFDLCCTAHNFAYFDIWNVSWSYTFNISVECSLLGSPEDGFYLELAVNEMLF